MHATFLRGSATEGDLLEQMMRQFYQEEHLAWAPACAAALRRLLADESAGVAYAIEFGGRRGGYYILTFGYSLEYGGRTGLLDELFVLPEMRGRGVGRAAVSHMLEAARAAGCGVVHLEADVTNTRAQELYRRAGFEKNGRDVFLRRL